MFRFSCNDVALLVSALIIIGIGANATQFTVTETLPSFVFAGDSSARAAGPVVCPPVPSDHRAAVKEFLIALYHAGCDSNCQANCIADPIPTGWTLNVTADICNSTAWPIFCDDGVHPSQLFLQNCMLTTNLPSTLGGLVTFNSLFLDTNSFTSLPVEVGCLHNLTQVDLSNNPWVALPDSLSMLTQLTGLTITFTPLVSLPDMFGALPLLSLELNNNKLTSLPPSINAASGLVVLDLSYNMFTVMPDIGGMSGLRDLTLSNNPLTTVTPAIAQLKNLRTLEIAYAQQTAFPTAVLNCSKLISLNMSHNVMAGEIPMLLFQQPPIMYLDLSYNQFEAWPSPVYFDHNPSFVTIILENNRLNQPVYSLVFNPPASAVLLGNNQLSGQLFDVFFQYSQDSASIVLFDYHNNSITGPLPPQYLFQGTPLLRALNVLDNPVTMTCNNATGNYTALAACLAGSPVALDLTHFELLPNGIQCPSLRTVDPSLIIQVDAVSYLQMIQCECQTNFYQAFPNREPELLCKPCPSNEWCVCQNGIITNCYIEVLKQNVSGAIVQTINAWPCPMQGDGTSTCLSLNVSVFGNQYSGMQCAPGHKGRLCADCEAGFYANNRDCVMCAAALHWLLPIAYILIFIVFFIYVIKVPGSSTGMLKIGTFYAQAALILVHNSGISWPTVVQQMFTHTSQAVGFSPTAIECVFVGISVAQKYWLYSTLPLILLCCCCAIFVAGLAYERLTKNSLALWTERCVGLSISVLMLIYFNLAVKLLSIPGCTVLGYDGSTYVNAYPWIECNASVYPYSDLIGIGITSFILYVIGIPVLVSVLLRRNRDNLSSAIVQRKYAYLYSCYRDDVYYWELVSLLQRLALALVLAVVPFTASPVAVVVITFLLLFQLCLQHAVQPFRSVLENRVMLAVLYVLLLSFISAMVSNTTPQSVAYGGAPSWISVLLIVVNALLGIFIVLLIALVFVASMTGKIANWLAFKPSSRFYQLSTMLQGFLQMQSTGPTQHTPLVQAPISVNSGEPDSF